MNDTIATIGYEGATIEKFVATLQRALIGVLIDVRDLPLSRKKGFSKGALAHFLADAEIEYVHLRGLGDPRDGRLAARAGKYDLFQRIFSAHMQTEIALHDLKVAAGIVRTKRACLMCFECSHDKCHRSIVAQHLAEMTGLAVVPLIVSHSPVAKAERPIRSVPIIHAGI